MEGNLLQQSCRPATTAVDKDDIVIPVSTIAEAQHSALLILFKLLIYSHFDIF